MDGQGGSAKDFWGQDSWRSETIGDKMAEWLAGQGVPMSEERSEELKRQYREMAEDAERMAAQGIPPEQIRAVLSSKNMGLADLADDAESKATSDKEQLESQQQKMEREEQERQEEKLRKDAIEKAVSLAIAASAFEEQMEKDLPRSASREEEHDEPSTSASATRAVLAGPTLAQLDALSQFADNARMRNTLNKSGDIDQVTEQGAVFLSNDIIKVGTVSDALRTSVSPAASPAHAMPAKAPAQGPAARA